jgi:hypothetical protein
VRQLAYHTCKRRVFPHLVCFSGLWPHMSPITPVRDRRLPLRTSPAVSLSRCACSGLAARTKARLAVHEAPCVSASSSHLGGEKVPDCNQMAYLSCGTSHIEAPCASGCIFHLSVAMLDELLRVGDNHTVNTSPSCPLFFSFCLPVFAVSLLGVGGCGECTCVLLHEDLAR